VNHHMKIGICNETFEDWPLERVVGFSRDCGYSGLELAPFTLADDVRRMTVRERHEVRSTIESGGMEVIGLHWLLAKTMGLHLTSPDDATRLRTADYLAELARLCHDLGGECLVLGSPLQRNLLPGVSRAQGMAYAAEVLQRTTAALHEYQVVLALEPLGPSEGDFLLTAVEALQLRDRVGDERIQLHLDVKAMSSEAIDIPTNIRASAAHLVHFHANDPNRRGPGMGDVDFVPILSALAEIAYAGWISVEVFDYSPGPEALARESIQYLQQCARRLDRSPA